MDGDLHKLQQDVDSARSAYFAERAVLQSLINPLFREPEDVGNAIVGIAEEFGVSGALSDLDLPARLGPLAEGVAGIDAVARDGLAVQLERLLEKRDQLDIATAAREDHLQAQNPNHLRRVHFEGYEYVVDGYYAELRGADPYERYPAPELALVQGESPSLTEQAGKDVPKAQPSPERGRQRGR